MSFEIRNPARPFVPASLAFPKKKARQLQSYFVDFPLSRAQEIIARALGWRDWHTMAQAIGKQEPSLADEFIDEEEVLNRSSTQIQAMLDARIPFHVEKLLADLALTCSSATAAKRLNDIGPWGTFEEPPDEKAPGIWEGCCTEETFCYRLSPEKQAAMAWPFRRDMKGWYDETWRVVLSFPQFFTEAEREKAIQQFEQDDPFHFEIVANAPARYWGIVPSIAKRTATARANPDALFALAVFPDWSIHRPSSDRSIQHQDMVVVSAIRGETLLRVRADYGRWSEKSKGPIHWYGMRTQDFYDITNPHTGASTKLSGLKGWKHPAVCELPFKQDPFAKFELIDHVCMDYECLVSAPEYGEVGPIP